jgi:hypothetical protein
MGIDVFPDGKTVASNIKQSNVKLALNNDFNIDPRGPFLTLPLGANFTPRGEVVPQG